MDREASLRGCYELLGVGPDAGPEEIKRAYRREAKRCHSDVTRGGDECMRALNEAYSTLADAGPRWRPGPAPPAPEQPQERPGPPDPYLTPGTVSWIVTDEASPEPATVRLSNRGGPVATIEPDRLGGAFWAIEESVGVMSGDDLADIVIAPVASDSMPAGTHADEVSFLFDGRPVTLNIVLTVARASAPKPPAHANGAAPARPPRRDRDGSKGAALALTLFLLLAIPVVVLANGAKEPAGTGAKPRTGLGLITQGGTGDPQWEVLAVDRGRTSFSVDFGGSQPAALESSCVYVRGTKVFPTAIAGDRYLQASPRFRSATARDAVRGGLEHRHSYTVSFPYYGAGRYRFVYGCSTDGLPAVDLFTRRRTSRAPSAASLPGPLYPDGVLAVARKSRDDYVKLGPVDLVGGDLVVHYRRAGSSERSDVGGRSCLRSRGGVIARPTGPNRRTLLMTGRDSRHIRGGSGTYELRFMCGGYEPALPIAAGLFGRGRR